MSIFWWAHFLHGRCLLNIYMYQQQIIFTCEKIDLRLREELTMTFLPDCWLWLYSYICLLILSAARPWNYSLILFSCSGNRSVNVSKEKKAHHAREQRKSSTTAVFVKYVEKKERENTKSRTHSSEWQTKASQLNRSEREHNRAVQRTDRNWKGEQRRKGVKGAAQVHILYRQ